MKHKRFLVLALLLILFTSLSYADERKMKLDEIRKYDPKYRGAGKTSEQVDAKLKKLKSKHEELLSEIQTIYPGYDYTGKTVADMEADAAALQNREAAAKATIDSLDSGYNYTGKTDADMKAYAQTLQGKRDVNNLTMSSPDNYGSLLMPKLINATCHQDRAAACAPELPRHNGSSDAYDVCVPFSGPCSNSSTICIKVFCH